MSTFDPATFLDSSTDAALDTRRVNITAGDWPATADSVDMKQWQSKDGSSSGLKLVIVWNVSDPTVNAETGRDRNLVRQDIMLDLDDSGKLATGRGKNRRLALVYDACNINRAGVTPRQIVGQMAKVRVTQRAGNDGELYDEVKEVSRLA